MTTHPEYRLVWRLHSITQTHHQGLAGDEGSGKTALCEFLTQQKTSPHYEPTLEQSFRYTFPDTNEAARILDISGSRENASSHKMWFQNLEAVALVFNVNDMHS